MCFQFLCVLVHCHGLVRTLILKEIIMILPHKMGTLLIQRGLFFFSFSFSLVHFFNFGFGSFFDFFKRLYFTYDLSLLYTYYFQLCNFTTVSFLSLFSFSLFFISSLLSLIHQKSPFQLQQTGHSKCTIFLLQSKYTSLCGTT